MKSRTTEREAVGGIWNMSEAALETLPELPLQSYPSLEAPPVAPMTGQGAALPTDTRRVFNPGEN